MKILIPLLLIFWVARPINVFGQKTELIGHVLDGTNSRPLEGALVTLSSEHVSTKTDKSGWFELSITGPDTILYVSYLGYETQKITLKVPSAEPFIVLLQPETRKLEEVVVSTGYEEIPLERATGSFEKIDNKLLNRSVSMDILSRIENITSGIFFNNQHKDINAVGPPEHDLYVRGISTLRNTQTGATAPLIVLDNFPYDGDIANINPNDIESVTVLKDAAASSIWGAKAGNGVIVITTKKANFSQPTRVSINHSINVINKPNLFAREVMKSTDIIDMEMFLFDQGFYNSKESKRAKPALSPVVELLIQLREGKIDSMDAYNAIDRYRGNDIRTDMLNEIYRNPVNRQYAVSIDGGGVKHKFRLFGGYDKMFNSQKGNENDRINIKLENSFNMGDKILIDSRIMWAQTKNTYASLGTTPTNYGSNGYPYPYIRLTDDDGLPLPVPGDYRLSFVDTAGRGKLLDWHYRPLDEINNPANEAINRELLINIGLTYKIASWMQAELKYQFGDENRNHVNKGSLRNYATRNLINRYTQIDSDGVVNHMVPLGGVLKLSNTAASSHRVRGQVNIKKNWFEKHRLKGLLGMDLQQQSAVSRTYDTYGYDEEFLTFITNIDHNTRYPIFANLAAASYIPNTRAFGGSMNRFVSIYGNLAYTFSDKYTITGSARKDASNLFGVSTNNKWTPLWSLGANWNLVKEPFVPDWFNTLNIRFSTGYSGNVDNSMSALTTIAYTTANSIWGIDWPATQIVNLPNRELRWEKVSTHNIGLDFSVWERRIFGSIDVYQKNTFDLLSPYPVDPTLGISTMIMNVASTEAKGVDFRLHSQNTTGKFLWSSDLMFTYNNNWIRKTYNDELNPVSYTRLGSLIISEGAMAYGAYSYKWAGLTPEDGQPMGYLNGKPSIDYQQIASLKNTKLSDLVLHGSARPLYFGSLRNTLTYRNMSISFNLTGKFSYFFRRIGMDYASLVDFNNGHADYYRRWQHPGDEAQTHVPAFAYPMVLRANSFYQNSEVLVERGDHIRLQDIRIAYHLDEIRVGKTVWLKNAQIFLFGNNIGFVWRANQLGLDPDVPDGIPLPRSVAIGMNFSF